MILAAGNTVETLSPGGAEVMALQQQHGLSVNGHLVEKNPQSTAVVVDGVR